MDQRLVAWGRSVKSRFRHRPGAVPPLWLFTDAERMPDLPGLVRQLPVGLCGVVFRHDDVAGRTQLGRQVWRICRARRLVMVMAGEALAGVAAGVHLRGGRGAGGRSGPFRTSSAHGPADLVRARRRGVQAIFLSPVFPTASHPGAPCLGVVRWAATAGAAGGIAVLALGGIDGGTVRRISRRAAGVGAIGAFVGGDAVVSRLPQCFAIAMAGPV